MTTYTNTLTCDTQINNRIVYREIIDEIIIALRNNITDRRNRTSYATDTFTGTSSTYNFELTQDLDSKNRHKLMNVKWVTVDGTIQTNYTDYQAGYRKSSPIMGKIHFWNAPSNGTSIQAYYGHTYHFIFEESPRIDLTTDSYPRVSVYLFNTTPKEMAIGGKVQKHSLIIQITVVDSMKDYVEETMQEIKDYFTNETVKHGFHTFDFIKEPRMMPMLVSGEDNNDVIFSQSVEYLIPNQYEISR